MAKMGRPKKDIVADKKVTVRLTEEEHDLLIEYCSSHEMTMTQVVREFLLSKLEKDKEESN